ncbi:16S rRNA (uracil(1498)-N(3))-methyltransferase [Williamsia sp. CHRR-6]|uniref:16S rRNA (uracil(1498)-N(3))-methyltransferase n=1 Tax=Williamsia sp. CHRR-6 TaxID=2835871 RepID=UPI001BD9B0EB|nr:16S rRNA (uracil(1498)-N(3))-methyltransferase [Williamsia sp. CHRR-6]MBT0565386.1 16S rRNA (uracil(1498)-N(3))-methyltransferase [Williamsia sp. CHRR-6]
MTPPLFWIDSVPSVGQTAELTGVEGHHALTVTRIRVGDQVLASDGLGTVATCEVTDTSGKDRLVLRALDHTTVAAPTPRVTLVQALPKSERSELVVELATEAGVDRIVAWQSARCVTRWVGPRAEKGIAKWRMVARTAAKQSRRPCVPLVEGPAGTASVRSLVSDVVGGGGVVAVLHEDGARSLADLPLNAANEVVLIVGPEGGIDPGELEDFRALGGIPVALGPEVLRTSTAAAVALGAIGVLTDRWARGRDR